MGTSWAWTGAPVRHRRPGRGSTRWMCLLDCGPQRDGAGELLPSPALFAEEAVGEGRWDAGVHDKIFHRSRQRTDAFQGDGAIFFFRVLEPSAPTTLTSWGRPPGRTPTTVASHDSRTPVSGGRASSGSSVDGRGETPSPLPSRGGVRVDADDRRWRRGRAVEFAYNFSRHNATGAGAVSITVWGGTPSSTRIVYSGNVTPKPGGGTPAVRAGRCCCHQNTSRYAASILSSSRNLWAPSR